MTDWQQGATPHTIPHREETPVSSADTGNVKQKRNDSTLACSETQVLSTRRRASFVVYSSSRFPSKILSMAFPRPMPCALIGYLAC